MRSPAESTTTGSPARARPRSAGEQLLLDVSALKRLCVRVEVYLHQTPVLDGPEVVQQALRDLAALLCTLEAALARALGGKDNTHAELA